MVGKLFWKLFICLSSILYIGTFQLVHSSPMYSSTSLFDSGVGRLSNGRTPVESDKSVDAVLEAMMELGGNVLFLFPQRDLLEKRDPPDLGTGRSYTGQRTAKVMWGQLASNSPSGPGRRKRNQGRKLNLIYSPEKVLPVNSDPEM